MNNVLLWIAQGLGIGRIPVAPGTFGSLLGLLWFAILLWPQNLWIFLGGTIAGLLLSVWVCGAGERVLNQTDPGSIVFDEIAAIPLCFVGWLILQVSRTGALPSPAELNSKQGWLLMLAVFALFRIFDVWKPWPVRQSQHLPDGWGVTADDALAAVYVNVVVLAIWTVHRLTTQS